MKAKRFIQSVRHTRPKQLFARLKLILKRKLESRRAQAKREILERPPISLALQEPKVTPLLPPRSGRIRMDAGSYRLCLLNETRHFDKLEWAIRDVSHLWFFNLHYMEYLEEVSNAQFEVLVLDWIDKNPAYGPGYWLGNWNAFVLSIRAVVWLQQYALRETELGEVFKTRMLDSVVQQTRFLRENLELDLCGNHLLKNLKALIWAGRFFASAEAQGWLKLGEERLLQELKEQILPDGLHYELSPAYHAQVFVDLLECYQCLEDGPCKTELHHRLCLAAQALADTTHPDGYCSQFNDGGLAMAYKPEKCLAAWVQLAGGHIQAQSVVALESAGFYGLRSGLDYLLIDCGPIGPDYLPGHGHGDIFAFEWSLEGQRLVVDTGVFEYSEGTRRSYARSSKAHNTLTLDGEDQCDFWGAFRVARRARVKRLEYALTDSLKLVAEHNGYVHLAGHPIHRRSFVAAANRLQITDEVIGGAGQKAEARILLHPECELEPSEAGLFIRRGNAKVSFSASAGFRLENVPYYPDFGSELPATQIVIEYGGAPCTGHFTLAKV